MALLPVGVGDGALLLLLLFLGQGSGSSVWLVPPRSAGIWVCRSLWSDLRITMPCQKQSVYSVSAWCIPPHSVLNHLYPISAGAETPFCSLGGVVTTGDISMASSKARAQSLPELLSQIPVPRSAHGHLKHLLCFFSGGPCQPEFSYGSCH